MIYTITISPAIDYVMHLSSMESGATNRSSQEEYYFGGKGINVSTILNQLGIENVALGFVAGFTGKALEEGLHEQGIKTDFIHLSNGITRINVKIKSGIETEINGQGAIPDESEFDLLADKLKTLSPNDKLILSGNVPKGLPDDTYDRLLTVSSSSNINSIVDTSGKLLLSTLKHHPFLIKPNLDELKALMGESIEPLSGARKLQSLGARNVIVSLGSKGAVLLSEDGKDYFCEPPEGNVLNTVGSGDSMVAGFVAGYEMTDDYGYAFHLASAAGAATAFSPGLATRDRIFECLKAIDKK